jgi:hypothetical protein
MRRKKAELLYPYVPAILVVILLVFPAVLLWVTASSTVATFIKNKFNMEVSDALNFLIEYLSVAFSVFLGVIVYRQSQRINSLESTKFDVFLGITELDRSFSFSEHFIQEDADKSDFSIDRNYDEGRPSFITTLCTGTAGKKQVHFLPLKFLTKNAPLITSLDFKKIHCQIKSSASVLFQGDFSREHGPLYAIFENDSEILLGVGLVIPAEWILHELLLEFLVSVQDQTQTWHILEIKTTLKYASSEFYLISSQTEKKSGSPL